MQWHYLKQGSAAEDRLLKLHSRYLAPDVTAKARQASYRELFDEVLDARRVAEIRAYPPAAAGLGERAFPVGDLEAPLGRCAKVRPAHRPAGAHKAL